MLQKQEHKQAKYKVIVVTPTNGKKSPPYVFKACGSHKIVILDIFCFWRQNLSM